MYRGGCRPGQKDLDSWKHRIQGRPDHKQGQGDLALVGDQEPNLVDSQAALAGQWVELQSEDKGIVGQYYQLVVVDTAKRF